MRWSVCRLTISRLSVRRLAISRLLLSVHRLLRLSCHLGPVVMAAVRADIYIPSYCASAGDA